MHCEACLDLSAQLISRRVNSEECKQPKVTDKTRYHAHVIDQTHIPARIILQALQSVFTPASISAVESNHQFEVLICRCI